VRCHECATSVPGGSSFCAACGAALARIGASEVVLACPGCGEPEMSEWGLAPSARRPAGFPVHGCRGCGGAWIDADTLRTVLEATAAAAPMEGHGTGDKGVHRRTMPPGAVTRAVVYRKCPVCQQTMLRRNFASVSGVVVDTCATHGTFFDAGELEDVLAFVRSGGLALAKRRDNDERASLQRAQLSTAQIRAETSGVTPWMDDAYDRHDPSLAFFSWAGRWVRNLFR
jgi:Zn-finger nucleic acid-binding protein